MKKVFVFFALLAMVAMVGCQQASSPSSTTTKTMPDATAQQYSMFGVTMAQGMGSMVAEWAAAGTPSAPIILGAQAGKKDVTGPVNGWYHIVETISATGLAVSIDIYAKLTLTGGDVTGVDIYGAVTLNMTSGGDTIAYSVSYGSANNPFHGTITWGAVSPSNVTLSGSIGINATITSATSGNHTLAMTLSTSSFSVPITAVADYPTGTITIAVTYDGTQQPDMVLTFDGDSSATFAWGGTDTTVTVTPSSVKSSLL